MTEPKTTSPCGAHERPQPLVEVLSRLAAELRNAAKETDRLHCLVDGVEWSNVEEKHELIHSAQAIDSIEQTLSGLSDFVCALAELAPGDWQVNGATAARSVKLAELAARLGDHDDDGRTDHPAGELEFF
ncbi:hypothetical protein MSC49_15370 [Methylosinus sp. C49]|uniref:hypothetical protein n=1 Tax=Methylosinus sp. C49 TaxID=2699395 RepID=UPI001366F01D|nr:hypothetical protein [Methylosinus sp. C49]BBU61602.1 hypothetical protein MSC49_15370 [Methylosinus sp. C49]